jgi:peptide deformylase
MARDVLVYPNPLLKEEAKEVLALTDEHTGLIADLLDTMAVSGHSVGIAAPQIGELWRIVVLNASLGKKPCENHGELVLINPEIVEHSGLICSREGCMSVPTYTGNVNRAERVVVEYMDLNFNRNRVEAVGFEAVVLQHEIDHLDGVLFIDRVISKKRDLFKRGGKIQ